MDAVLSPAQNRVTPLGEIVATPLRGAFTGNRGRLHEGREIVRSHAGDLWITCALRFKERWEEQWQPRRFTWLFFHDEAVALAAGHRPCGECRHAEYVSYKQAWATGLGGPEPSAREMNRRLHGERIVRGSHRRRLHEIDWRELPVGAFVALEDGTAALVLEDSVVRWSAAGYGDRTARPRRGAAAVITPPASVAVLRAGYAVQIDAGAHAGADGA
jgi:hypothetical protein